MFTATLKKGTKKKRDVLQFIRRLDGRDQIGVLLPDVFHEIVVVIHSNIAFVALPCPDVAFLDVIHGSRFPVAQKDVYLVLCRC